MLFRYEAVARRGVEHLPQRGEVAVDVQHGARLRVDPELGPCHGLEELVEGAEPPGQHHERV
jgi:hypothetical protein